VPVSFTSASLQVKDAHFIIDKKLLFQGVGVVLQHLGGKKHRSIQSYVARAIIIRTFALDVS